MAVSDEQIGRNLTRMRGDMSQKELAARMKERGWRWSQTTVWSVESGERPLRLAEAEDLKSILGSVWSLTMDDADMRVVSFNQWMSRANAALEDAVREYVKAQANLRIAVETEGVSPGIANLASGWLDHSPEMVVSNVEITDDLRAEADERIYEAMEVRDGKRPEAP